MTDTEQSLLTLLRRALFGCELPLPTDVDWQRIFEEAVSHSVHLLVYDCLTEQERAAIPKETAVPWRQEVLSAMWYNVQLLGEQQAVLKALSGLPCVILKGSSSAACYPRPELRCAGDIDLLILPADLEKAEAILSARGYRPSENNHPFHRAMLREPFIVELHFELPGIPLGTSGAPLREYFQTAVGEGIFRGGLPVLPPERQAVLLLLHKLEHITSSGLGLRQLCDWAVFVYRDMTPERWEDLLPKLSRFRLLHLRTGHYPHLRGEPCPAAGGRSVVHDCHRRTMPRPAGGYSAYRELRLQVRTLWAAALYRWTGGKSTGQFLPHRRGDLPYPLACLQGASPPAACRTCRVGAALPWAEKGRKMSAVSPPCRVPQRRRATEALPRPSPL